MAIVNKPDNGGPAFPALMQEYDENSNPLLNPGMFLRDNFAGLAMQAFASDPQMAIGIREAAEQAGISAPEMMARTAYALADAMIAERNRTGGG